MLRGSNTWSVASSLGGVKKTKSWNLNWLWVFSLIQVSDIAVLVFLSCYLFDFLPVFVFFLII